MDLILKQYNIIKTHGTSQRPGPLAFDLLWPIHYFLKNNAGPNHHIHWCRTCSSQSHVHKHNNSGSCLQCSCHGSGHFQLNVINKPIRIQASQAAGLDLINAITCSLTKQYTSIPSDPWALNLLMSNNNFMKKTMHISLSDQLILLWSIHYFLNKTMHVLTSTFTGAGPVHPNRMFTSTTIRVHASNALAMDLVISN